MVLLSFSNIHPLKSQVYAVARALFNLNAHCGTVFFLLDKKDVHDVGQHFNLFVHERL